MGTSDLYNRDFFEWTSRNAELLRAGRFDEVDVEHVAQEIGDMGNRERREVYSRLRVLMVHLVKWAVQPEWRDAFWKSTIEVEREDLELVLQDSPSLRRYAHEQLPTIYQQARKLAAGETGQPVPAFPPDCGYPLDRILDSDFLPE